MAESRPLLLLLLLSSLLYIASPEPTADKAALLEFLSKTPHGNRVQWNPNASACSWIGVTCDANQSAVVALRLPGVGLVGPIPLNTLSRLSSLRVLSLRSNRLSGPLPSDLSNLSLLRSLYLQGNQLSGGVPAGIGRMGRLARLDLSANNFTGEIPFAIGNLSRLTGLFLEENGLSGRIPSIDIPGLVAFNVSHNRLNGSIPKVLERFPASSFQGNLDLCGGPLQPCSPFFPSPAPSPSEPGGVVAGGGSKKKKLSTGAIIAIAIAAGVLLLLLLLLLVCCVLRRRRRTGAATIPQKPPAGGAGPPRSTTTAAETGTSSTSKDDIGAIGGGAGGEKNKLVFFEDGMYSFDLEDLLRASAEVLGKGSVGTSYKAVLEDGTTVVVKRLKDVAVSKREFEVQMEGLGKVGRHENVVPLRAYYYSKDEKLLVYDYLPAGSLSALLHGSRGSGRTPLDWDNRLRIALAAGRGLMHLHMSANVAHGNVKASNVLLRPDPDAAAVSDFGLSPLFGTAIPQSRVAGYRAPEVLETRRPTLKSDVYSFGVLLLELLTGKAPNQAMMGEEGIDLPKWVQSVVREEWTAEVFDVELMRYQNVEEEMVQLLQIALHSTSLVPDARPDIHDVVRNIEEIANRMEGDEGQRPASGAGSGGPTTPPAAPTP